MADRLDLQRMAAAFRAMGWVAFWSQLAMAVVCAGVLAFNSIGSDLIRNRDRAIGLGPGLSLTTLALLVMAYSIWQDWGLIRLSRALAGGTTARPSKAETTAQVKRHLLASLAGVTLAAIGYQALAGSLTFQASIHGKDPSPHWTFNWPLDQPLATATHPKAIGGRSPRQKNSGCNGVRAMPPACTWATSVGHSLGPAPAASTSLSTSPANQ